MISEVLQPRLETTVRMTSSLGRSATTMPDDRGAFSSRIKQCFPVDFNGSRNFSNASVLVSASTSKTATRGPAPRDVVLALTAGAPRRYSVEQKAGGAPSTEQSARRSARHTCQGADAEGSSPG